MLECWNWFPNIFETNLKNWETHTIHSHQRTVAQDGKRIPAINPSTPRAPCWKFPGNIPSFDLGRRTLWGHKRSANLKTVTNSRGRCSMAVSVFNQNPNLERKKATGNSTAILSYWFKMPKDIHADSPPVKMLFTPNINQSARSSGFSAKNSRHWSINKNVFQARESNKLPQQFESFCVFAINFVYAIKVKRLCHKISV